MATQPRLPQTTTQRARRHEDYVGLFPEGVMPIGKIQILERGENLLLIKDYDHGQKIAGAHRRIYKLLIRYGNNPDAPGTITIACVWGLGQHVGREIVIFDHQGEHPAVAMSVEQWREWVSDWWRESRRAR